MFVEVALMGGVLCFVQIKKSGGTNEVAKIQKICNNAGLYVKEGGVVKSIHIMRKNREDWGMEYVYRIPLGLSFKAFQEKQHVIQDGLNNKYLAFEWQDLKKLKLNKPILKQIRDMRNKTVKKEVFLEYDGMLKIRVYHQPLTEELAYEERTKGWCVPVGQSRTDYLVHDFEEINHIIVAGMTRYGKSVFLKNVVTSLVRQKPKNVSFTLVDLKGGLTFGRYKDLKQVNTVAKDVGEALVALREIETDMNRRMVTFLDKGWENVKEAKFKDRHFIVIDEAAQISSGDETDKEIKKMKVECERIITEIARIGGGIGYRLVYATQYPTNETIKSQVRQNCDARLCFKLKTGIASRAVLDEEGAEALPFVRGRAIYQTDRNHIVQTPHIQNDYIEKVIEPHITIRGKKAVEPVKREARRSDTLVIEETGLS